MKGTNNANYYRFYLSPTQEICKVAAGDTYSSTEDLRNSSSTFRDLAYWDLETINSTIQFIIHELHPPDVHVFLDIEIYPEEDENEISVKECEGSCHPLHHDSSYYVIILYCKRSNDGNDHIMHYLFAVNDGLGQK